MKADARAFLMEILRGVYRPPERVGLAEWAEKNIVLSRKESIDGAGRYRRDRSILMPKLFDEFFGNSVWKSLTIKKGSQASVTLHTLLTIVRRLAEDPVNTIYSINSEKNAKNISRRLLQLMKDCPLTARIVEEAGEAITQLTYELPGMNLWLLGSHSAGDAAEKTAGLIVNDELDKQGKPKGEASMRDLLAQRGKEVTGAKELGFGTPTTEDADTHVWHAKGSQHVAFLPCPFCGYRLELNLQAMEFKHCKKLRGWDLERVVRDTFVRCKGCDERVDERHKPAMLREGRWEPTNFEEVKVGGEVERVPVWEPGMMSAHYSDWYSVHPNSTWGLIVKEFLLAQANPRRLQNVNNSRFGLAVKNTVAAVSSVDVRRLCGKYRRGTLPWRPAVVVLIADSQGDHQKYMLLGFSLNGDCSVVDWGRTLEYGELDGLFAAGVPSPDGKVYCQRAMIDEGGKDGTSYEVRTFCSTRFPQFMPAKGVGGAHVRHSVSFSDSRLERGGLTTIPVCHFDDDGFKRLVYQTRIAKFDPVRSEEEGVPRIWLPEDVDEGLIKELCSEQLVWVLGPGGRRVPEWKVVGPNDWGDTLKMGHVLWSVIGPELVMQAGRKGV